MATDYLALLDAKVKQLHPQLVVVRGCDDIQRDKTFSRYMCGDIEVSRVWLHHGPANEPKPLTYDVDADIRKVTQDLRRVTDYHIQRVEAHTKAVLALCNIPRKEKAND